MLIAGISAYYHDSAAALLQDGKIVAAAEEERFSRRKHDSGFPHHALRYCLAEARVNLSDVDRVVFYDKPFLKFERILETAVAFAPRGFQAFARSMPAWLQDKLFLKRVLARELRRLDGTFDADERMLFSEHHLSHAASAYFPSPFESAAVLTIDGVGEWATTSLALGNGNALAVSKEIHFPHSLGLMYSAFTQYCGFEVNSGEYKLMGLAPYGEPRFAADILEHIIDLKDDGSFRLKLDYFGYCTGARMINRRFEALMGGPARQPETPIDQKYMDVAASIQAVTEEAILRMTRAAVTTVDKRIGEVLQVTRGFPDGGRREDGRVEPHDIGAHLHHRAPPCVLDVAQQQHTDGAVVVGGAKAAVDLGRLENEAAALRQVHDLVEEALVGAGISRCVGHVRRGYRPPSWYGGRFHPRDAR